MCRILLANTKDLPTKTQYLFSDTHTLDALLLIVTEILLLLKK